TSPATSSSPSTEDPHGQVDGGRQDDRVVDEAEQAVPQHGAPDLAAGDRHVRDLEAHADGEREVGEVEVGGVAAAGELQAAHPLVVVVIVEVRVAQREHRL